MIITISGEAGSGKSTVGKIVAEKIGFKHYSIGDLLRELAVKKGISLLEISKLAESDRAVDDYLDNRQVELGKQKNLVLDSRLGFHFIPKSFKVFLTASQEEAARRIFSAQRDVEKENSSLKKTIENIRKRKASESLRYSKLYNADPYDESNYDLVIDTTKLSPEEVAKKIVSESKLA